MNVLPKSNEINVELFIRSLKKMTTCYKILCLKEKRTIIINNSWFKYNKAVIDYWIKARLEDYINSRNNIINIDEIVEEFFN